VDRKDEEKEEEEDIDEDGLRKSETSDQTDELAKSMPGIWDRIIQTIDWENRLRRCLFLAAFACILRPTNILIWICVACFALFRPNHYGKFVALPWVGTVTWVEITSLSLFPATGDERKTLFREAALCGYECPLLT